MCSWVSNGLTFCVSFLVLCWFLLGPFDKFDEQVGAQHVFFSPRGGEVDVLLIWNIFQRFCIDDNYTSLLGDSKGWRGCCLELAASVRTRQKRARVNMDTFEIGQKLQGEVHLGWCWGAGCVLNAWVFRIVGKILWVAVKTGWRNVETGVRCLRFLFISG